ncbi:DUF488 domain-containing protein [Agromyces archimandritae]|uniref:DUF488 family protein n=1 Tax=Agromyces archimandritae TaxID=2781962 RepID=A0A975IPA6_9MICO|nr:DUF488 family protein [Agromyces archimandritae]QTX05074.1 DUF488 family protein [Agromyces archimandritae]
MVYVMKRVYEPEGPGDGFRVLVDRMWPRGVSKSRADLAEWDKDVAPSRELREWFGHDPAKMDAFAERYRAELDANPAAKELLALGGEHDTVTLLYGAKDEHHNQAVVLLDWLADHGADVGRPE